MTPDGPTVRFTILDPDGAEGFPGNLNVTVLYTLTNDNFLKIQYYATTDKPTPINLTHHSYFDLSGGEKGQVDVLNDVCKIFAPHYLPVDKTLIPTGEIASVTGTPFDFTKSKLIGQDIKSLPGAVPGYDHTMVLDNPNGALTKAAEVYDPNSHRLLECWTTEPAVHFFTATNLNKLPGKDGEIYNPYRAFCFETQHFPDSPNHKDFPNTILRPGQVYRQVTVFQFYVLPKPMEVGQ
jgi:aldose 1-epimerase